MDDGVHGNELWKSDGTKGGHRPGQGHPPRRVRQRARRSDRGGEHGVLRRQGRGQRPGAVEVRRHRLGTVLVKDIRAGSATAAPTNMTGVGETLFFTADDGTTGRELWKSDGTGSGTVLVKDIDPDRRRLQRRHTATDRRSGTGCSSPSTTATTAGSCGPPTAPNGHRPGQGHPPGRLRQRARLPDRSGGHLVLQRQGRLPRAGAVEVRRHRGGHRPRQGHPSRCRGRSSPAPDRLREGRCSSAPTTAPAGPSCGRSDGTEAGTVLVKDVNLGGAFTVASRGTPTPAPARCG